MLVRHPRHVIKFLSGLDISAGIVAGEFAVTDGKDRNAIWFLRAIFLLAMARAMDHTIEQFGKIGPRAKPVFGFLGRLAMADIFLMALYVVIIKGVAMTRVEVGWGLYLFTFCVLASLLVTLLEPKRV